MGNRPKTTVMHCQTHSVSLPGHARVCVCVSCHRSLFPPEAGERTPRGPTGRRFPVSGEINSAWSRLVSLYYYFFSVFLSVEHLRQLGQSGRAVAVGFPREMR